MTFTELSKKIATCYSSLPALVDALRDGFANVEGGGGGGSSDIEYSTTERKIGKWIDGSDIYQRVIEINSMSFDQTAFNDYYGRFALNDYVAKPSNIWVDLTHSTYMISGAPRSLRRWSYVSSDNALDLYVETSRSNMPVTLVIQYTKAAN